MRFRSAVIAVFLLPGVFAGCGSDQTQGREGVGSVDMTVTLATPPSGPNEQIDAVDVSLYCDGIDPVLGVPRPPQSDPETFSINTSTSQGPEPKNSIGLLEKRGLPAGDCHFSFNAVSNTGNTTCTGELTVPITTNQVTESEVVLACIHEPRFGGVRTDGTFNQCAEYRQILVTPTTQSIDNLVDVATEVYDPDGDDVTVSVTTAGACDNPAFSNGDTAASCTTVSGCEAVVNTVECIDAGPCEVTVAVSDDGFESCTGLLPDGSNNNAARKTIAVDCTAPQGLCAGVTCPDAGECVTNFCDPADGVCKPRNDGINTGCDLGGGPGTGVCDAQGACVECNIDAQCGAGEFCVDNVCQADAPFCEYVQNFEALDQASPSALSDDGWQIFGQVFDGSGELKFGYGPFPAPNAAVSPSFTFFSAIVTDQGGPDQGAQQLSVFNDYNCCTEAGPEGHFNGTDRVQSIVFQEPRPTTGPIAAGDIGSTVTFSFDAKRGNINDPADPQCLTPNVCDSTALAYIQTLDPNADLAQTRFVTIDTTSLPDTWARYEISLELDDPLLKGQILQVGFLSAASNFEPSGVFYDNVEICFSDGGPGIERRPLPEIYFTGNAINYSPYRAGGPEVVPTEMPSDADIREDLALLQTAGYNLIRLFGGDAVSERILQLAEASYPEMQFQQGLFIGGLAPGPEQDNCDSAINDSQVATAIRLANTYSNVVTVSVGNETSFFSAFMPLNCLEGYIRETRNNVTQPVTADDDYTFYANFFGREPDGVLREIDFVAIHMYPITNYRFWDWRQESVPAGPLRAEAMMNEALAVAQGNYQAVYDYQYRNASGVTVSVGDSLPIVVGETGWKWRQTAPSQEIETYAATEVNARWYYDLMLGWERSPGGPPTIFIFQATDEAWKTTDDGWGLWDENRNPRYALCDTPAGAPCNVPIYDGAGFYPF